MQEVIQNFKSNLLATIEPSSAAFCTVKEEPTNSQEQFGGTAISHWDANRH